MPQPTLKLSPTRIRGLAIVVALTLVLAGCCVTPDRVASHRKGQVQHVVVCWLKDPGNAAHRRQLIEASHSLRSIPGVRSVRVGGPIPSDRPVVDDSFDIALVITLKDAAALAEYETHPLHKQRVADTQRPLVAKFVIYDFVAE